MMTPEEFFSQTSKAKFSERLDRVFDIFVDICEEPYKISDMIIPLEQHPLKKEETFTEWQLKASEGGWEGLMLRKDEEYKGKRSSDILKVKKMNDNEWIVKRIETGPLRVIEDGKDVTIETMTNIVIDFDGDEVSVGSGFSLGQRKQFMDDPSLIVGKEATIQYFEYSKDKTGKKSLRFPVYKTHYMEKRDI